MHQCVATNFLKRVFLFIIGVVNSIDYNMFEKNRSNNQHSARTLACMHACFALINSSRPNLLTQCFSSAIDHRHSTVQNCVGVAVRAVAYVMQTAEIYATRPVIRA